MKNVLRRKKEHNSDEDLTGVTTFTNPVAETLESACIEMPETRMRSSDSDADLFSFRRTPTNIETIGACSELPQGSDMRSWTEWGMDKMNVSKYFDETTT